MKNTDKELKMMQDEIEKAVRAGKTNVTIYERVSKDTRKKLQRQGCSVKVQPTILSDDGCMTLISW